MELLHPFTSLGSTGCVGHGNRSYANTGYYWWRYSANNVVKLDQVMYVEDQIRLSSRRQPNNNNIVPDDNNDKKEDERMIQVMIMSMEEFTHEPHAATMRFLDFALEESSSTTVKEQIAVEYKNSYNDKLKKGDKHITNDKSITNGGDISIAEKKEEMIEYLRKHRLFGRVGEYRTIN